MEENNTEPAWKKFLGNSLILMSFLTASWELKKIMFDKDKINPSYEIVYQNGDISKISGLENQTKISYIKTNQSLILNFDPCDKISNEKSKGDH